MSLNNLGTLYKDMGQYEKAETHLLQANEIDKKVLGGTTKEYAILRLMAARPGQTISRETFLDEVWEYNAWPTTRTVDNFIAALRARLQPGCIETVRGAGYRLALAPQ